MPFDRKRVEALLQQLERMAAGDPTRLPITEAHDELDAIAHGVNVLADEVQWTNARIADAERKRAVEMQREKEKAERANEAKSVFLRTASHEIRTPIAAILGIADQLAYSGLSEDDQALVERLRENSRALLSLVGNVLDLSRLDADKLTLNVDRFSPYELVSEVVKSVEGDARAKKLPIHIDSVLPTALTITTDRVRLRQILVNVIANAVKFTSSGEVRIVLRSERMDDIQRLAVDVIDSGIGIDRSQRRYLFEPFGQADSSISRAHGGTGLGLALSSRLAERLGGHLVLHKSELGKGSTFRLTLVTNAVADEEAAAAPVHEEPPPLALEGVRVLLADDHPDLRKAIGHSLQMDGATIEFAQDGGEAVAKAKSGAYDVVLMDLLMPVMSGFQATRELRKEGFKAPVISISADASPEIQAASLAAGCNAHLAKPFGSSDLADSILAVRRNFTQPAADGLSP